jgi:UDP-glucuronate 4-epimerase
VRKLLSKGYFVVCVDDFNDFYNPAWKRENVAEFLGKAHFELVEGDITDFNLLKRVFSEHKFSKVLHLAARAGVRPSIERPLLYEKVNVLGTLNLLELCRKFEVSHFVFASSSSVYGNQEKVPFSETDPVNEPISPYAASKKSCEMFAYTYAHLYGIKTTGLRFFTVYGPSGRPDLAVYKFTDRLMHGVRIEKYGDGRTSRDYTFIDDIVGGVMKCVEREFDFEIFNLGNNKPLSLNEMLGVIEKITGKKFKIRELGIQPGDVMRTYADVSKAGRMLGWQPTTSFEDGYRKFWQWYQEERLK